VARLLADENLPWPVVEALRRLGHDVVTVADWGEAGHALADRAVLQLAAADGRAAVTLNRRHFVRLHHADPAHAGIVVCTVDLDFDALARRIDAAIRSRPALTGQLVRITRGQQNPEPQDPL
jgi:predicted nuclease of predicted toxin-antitoxin system